MVLEALLPIPLQWPRSKRETLELGSQGGGWPQVILPGLEGKKEGGRRGWEAGAEFKTAINLIIHDTSHSRTLSSSG